MNPAGIPAFYGAFSEDVAVAEVRPPVGSLVAVAKFSVIRPVRLLDVSFLPYAYHEESIFSAAYDRLRNKVGFLEKFHRRISRPVLPSDEVLAYLPTQAVAAYVANVMGLDGMIYGSIQIGAEGEAGEQVDRQFCNIALFGTGSTVAGVEAPRPADDIEALPRDIFPGFASARNVDAPLPVESVAPADPPPRASELAANRAITIDEGGRAATLRAEPQPRLVRIRSVKVETSAMFAHLYDDGSVIIDDFDDDDE
jgi:hypothetical protein